MLVAMTASPMTSLISGPRDDRTASGMTISNVAMTATTPHSQIDLRFIHTPVIPVT